MPSAFEVAEQLASSDKDLRTMSPTQQGEFLRAQESINRLRGTIDQHVYLLSNRAHDVLAGLGGVELGLHDVDGTHTIVGGYRLDEKNLRGLEEAATEGVRNVAVTGRHAGQMNETIKNHPGRTPFQEWLFEQGFFIRREDGRVEMFEGTPSIEHNVVAVREFIGPLLSKIAGNFGVRFQTTSEKGEGGMKYEDGAHKTMYSLDVLEALGDKKVDHETHARLYDYLESLWLDEDPEGRVAAIGTSSTGVVEWTPDGLNKGGSVLSYLSERGVAASRAIYLGDSKNDLKVTLDVPDLPFAAIVNDHTDDDLIKGVDIAAVGVANAMPILRRLARARNAAKKIVV